MQLDKEKIQGHFIERFIDTSVSIRVDGYDHSMTPIGDDEVFTLRLGSDGHVEFHHEKYDAYSGIIRWYCLSVRGQWELRGLQEDRFAVQIIHPEFEIVEGNMSPESLLKYYQTNCMFVGTGNIWFAPCPELSDLK
jgi:hypothetical protein